MHNVLLTGYTGFVGSHLLNKLDVGYKVSLLGRKQPENLDYDFYRGELNIKSDFGVALANIKTVIHCAARAHIMNNDSQDPLAEFREVNTYGALNLAKQAASLGVKRFIFISSIKVNGESTENGTRFSSRDKYKPEDPYGISKAEAEEGLLDIAKEAGMEIVIIRPTLVYGPGVKGNFLNLLKLSKLPIPLPFGLVNNKRSMVYLDNLVDLIVTCIDHQNAANRIFLVSDCDDLSLVRLLTLIRQAMNKSSLLLPIPVFLFNLMGRLTGKAAVVDRLVGNLQVDSSDAKKYLDWSAPYTVEQGIKATVDDFLNKLID
ncbi:MAG: UDP-glucose 4-epimerase [Oleispira sp.]|jgi:UDP-glucose 4-epimerase